MVFQKVEQLPDFPELERKILDLWKSRDVFHRSLAQAEGRPHFVFYEGPPTANGLPHNGHVLTRVMKDLFPRYRTMRGNRVERRAGWDTHGLPVEVEVEKELQIRGKQAIMEYGVEPFARKCLDSVFRYTAEWEHLTERIGFWVDLDKAYVTFHKSYVESVWWALAELFKKGLLYKGHKVVWWWAQGGTALSSGETGDSYKTVDDPSVYVRFPLRDERASLVVWTTTPWTLSSNMFVAVHGELDYVYAKDPKNGEILVVAEGLRVALEEKLGRKLQVEKTVKGETLFGKRYRPPFDTYANAIPENDPDYFRVVPGDVATAGPPQWFVTLKAGTGVVHVAPAFGEDDWKVWRRQKTQAGHDIPLLCAVKPDGKFDASMDELEGTWVKDADKPLVKKLDASGLLLHSEIYRHEYPFCWRSDRDPLIQYARDAWFIRTTAQVDQTIENNQHVTWLPEHIRDGRFGDFLAGNVDWALSRERFWGTPLNIWECEGCDAICAPASCAELESKNPQAFERFRQAQRDDPELSEHLMVHKPWIDGVTLPCEECGSTMKRVPEVIDCWFDSGCMPFAQFGYPHQAGSETAFQDSFPADFISEAIDQTRGWFYSLMIISNLLFPEREAPHPYKRCIVLGHVSDKFGKKESKSAGNYTPPEVILDRVRMGFAAVQHAGVSSAAGEALIAREDLEGLDLNDGAEAHVYREGQPPRSFKLRAHKKLPRRQIVLSEADRADLGVSCARPDIRPVDVPTLDPTFRVVVEVKGVPAPGADAFRWFFYASNPPWNNTRHSLANVRSQQKELPIKLRSVYAFFVTYAEIDGFDPAKEGESRRRVEERGLLDRWVMSELEETKRAVLEAMDDFRSYDAAQALNAFVESLSNWYVRRSRSRFWASERSQDKLDAYWTLYTVLKELCLYLAPFLPFQAEDIYQNLVVGPFGEAPQDSVHLCLLPQPAASLIDKDLSETMAHIRELVSLGLKVRTDSKLRIRQPLASARIILADADRAAQLSAHVGVMAEELNVKSIEFVENVDDYVHYRIKANFQRLGKRLGKRMKAAAACIQASDPQALKAALDADGRCEIDVDGELLALEPEDVLIEVSSKAGFAAAGASLGVVVLDTTLDDALVAEGLYREVLSKIQSTRKVMDLDYTARIKLAIDGDPAVVAACQQREEALCSEVLAESIAFGGSIGAEKRSLEVDGKALVLEVVDNDGRT